MDCMRVACRICGQVFQISNNCTFVLGAHLTQYHPDANLTQFLFCDDTGDGIRCDCDCGPDEDTTTTTTTDVGGGGVGFNKSFFKWRQNNDTCDMNRTNKKIFKRICVENWRTGVTPMQCPKCKEYALPYIKRQKNKMVNNRLGAFFLFKCWPICFMPLLMTQKATVTVICCRKCGYCFGTYNTKNGTFTTTPNPTSTTKKK